MAGALASEAEVCVFFAMATLRQFLTERRAEIQQQIKMLRAELRELDVAASALPDAGDALRDTTDKPRRERREGPTLKTMAVEILKQNPDGLDANDIRAKIAQTFGVEVQRSSMSPQLSRLAKDGIVRLAGHRWLLRSNQADWLGLQNEDTEDGRTMLKTSPGPGMP